MYLMPMGIVGGVYTAPRSLRRSGAAAVATSAAAAGKAAEAGKSH